MAVVSLNAPQHVRKEPNAATIDLLERLLTQARAGDLLHVVGAGINADASLECFCSADFRVREAVGALEILKHDIIARN